MTHIREVRVITSSLLSNNSNCIRWKMHYICQCSVQVTELISSIRCSLIPTMTSPGSTSICEVALCCSSQAAQLAESLPFNTELKITLLINIHIHLAEGDTLCLTKRSSTRCSRLSLSLSHTHTHTNRYPTGPLHTSKHECTFASTWACTRACML